MDQTCFLKSNQTYQAKLERILRDWQSLVGAEKQDCWVPFEVEDLSMKHWECEVINVSTIKWLLTPKVIWIINNIKSLLIINASIILTDHKK